MGGPSGVGQPSVEDCRETQCRLTDAGGQASTSPRTAASHLAAGHSLVHVPQTQSGLLSPSSHASVGDRMEDHHGADAREANHVAIMSLREVMIRGLLKEWKTRLQAFQANDEARNTATRLQWLDSLGHWNHMHCCPAKQDLVLTEKTESQSTEEVLTKISELETLVTGDSIKNFKSIRQLRESYQAEWVQFLLEIQIRGPGDRLWTIFTELVGSAAAPPLGCKATSGSPPVLGPGAERPSSALVRSAPQHNFLDFPLQSISFLNPSSTTYYMNCSIHAVLHILALLQPQDQAALGQLCHLWGAIQRNPQGLIPAKTFNGSC